MRTSRFDLHGMKARKSDILGLSGGVPARQFARTMATPIRIQYPGAVCHPMARGGHGQELFQDDQDRQRFRETLGEACAKTGFRVQA